MPAKPAVIFDCDGVLFDSRQANINYYNHLLARFGLPPLEDEDIDYIHMHTADRSTDYIFRGTPHATAAQAYRLQMDYRPFIDDLVMEPGLLDLLRQLQKDYRLAVATNRSQTIAEVLERFALAGFFSMVVSSLDVQHPKPHPEPLLKIVDALGLNPSQAVFVGDSEVDLQSAQAAEMPFIAYRNPRLPARLHARRMREVGDLLRKNGQM